MRALQWWLMVFISCLAAMECFMPVPMARATEEVQAKPEASAPREKSIYGPIQRREYRMDHEIDLGWAYLPLDPYCKGYGVQLAYTIHFNQVVALELFRVGWSYNVDTSLKTKLIDQMPDISPNQFPSVIFFENTNLLLKLLYGKHTFLNRKVLHFEVFATAGGAFLVRSPFNVFDMDASELMFDFGLNGGFGFRIWLDTNWSVRMDLRDTVIFLTINKGELPFKNSALVGLSLSVNL